MSMQGLRGGGGLTMGMLGLGGGGNCHVVETKSINEINSRHNSYKFLVTVSEVEHLLKN